MFKVGDVVEVVGSKLTPPDWQKFIGSIAIVSEVRTATNAMSMPGAEYCILSPRCGSNTGWYSKSLRKINPPDWSAPVTTDQELSA